MPMTHRKKLIEVALPLEAINQANEKEKNNPFLKGHPRTIHLWWARRPMPAARAVIFTSLVDDPDDPNALPAFVEACKRLPIGANVKASGDTPRMRLFDFIERLVTWEATTDKTILDTAYELIQIATEGNPPPLLDPFAGGGGIPLEAQRLGLEAHASDLNPVAVMINKAQIEIPSRFIDMPPVNPCDRSQINSIEGWKHVAGLAADVRYYGGWIRDRAWEILSQFYPTHNGETVVAWRWARTVRCPNPACGAVIPLVASFELSKKKGKRVWIEPQVDKQSKNIGFEVKFGKGKLPEPTKTGRGSKFRCLVCKEIVQDEYMKQQGSAGRLGSELLAIITEGLNERHYHAPTNEQQHIAKNIDPVSYLTGKIVSDRRWFSPPIYGFTEFSNLFTSRQLVTLTTFTNLITDCHNQIFLDAVDRGLANDSIPLREGGNGALAYAEAISVYLGLAVSKWSDYHNTICSWNTTNENIRNLFARQAIPMTWDYVEANPFGSKLPFDQSFGSITQVLEHLVLGRTSTGYVTQRDAAKIECNHPVAISTDPPYYDNIGYADLSDFFYVWLRQSLRNIYPNEFGTLLTPKELELIASQHRHGSKDRANNHFESGLYQVFSKVPEFITHNYPMTVFYAFKQQDADFITIDEKAVGTQIASTGWETMLSSLINSGFSIDGTWPMRTERSARSVSLGTNALASSIVLVCRPRPEDAPTTSRRAFLDDLRHELPAALNEMQSGNIAPVDLAQASIGPGMAIYSRYSKVLEADGTPMSIRTALGLINAALDEYLAEQDGEIDPDTRFAVDWFTQFGFNEGDFGQADVLARAKNTSVAGIEAAGLVVSGRGKVRLIHWSEHGSTNTPDTGDPSGRSTKSVWNPQEDKRPTVWEATHHLIGRLNNHGETGSAMLLNTMPPDMAAEARQLAYRLYSICERKGWADHAREYNALVVSWSGIGEVAAQQREAAARGDATTQMGMFDDHT